MKNKEVATRRCGLCDEPGHNARTCSKRGKVADTHGWVRRVI